jgi:hypothetical protein
VSTVRPFEHYFCGVCGFLFAVALSLLFYPFLVATTGSLGVLATTAIVSTVVFGWGLAWLALELLWEWYAGRLFVSHPP